MAVLVSSAAKYRYLAVRSGSGYRELFVNGTSTRAQSLVSDMENEGLSAEQIAEDYHIPLDAVFEAAEYVHQNEDFLAEERCRSRQRATAKGYLRAAP